MIEIDHFGAAAFLVVRRDDGAFVYQQVNAAVERMTGISRAAFERRGPHDLFAPALADLLVAKYGECVARRDVVDFECCAALPLGVLVTRTTLTPLLDKPGGEVKTLLGVSVDTTEQHQLREDLRRSNARLAVAVDALGGAPWYYDVGKQEFELTASFDRILGITTPYLMGMQEWLGHVHPDDRNDTCFADIMAGRAERGTAEFRVIAHNGDVRWLMCRRRSVAEAGVVAGIAGIVVDITQEKRREAALSLQATSDPLTGLANRRRFDEILNRERDWAARHGGALSLLMIDVDHFKRYNDRYGHIAGDAVLSRLARSLRDAVERHNGFAARYGGEEFVAVLPGAEAPAATRVAEEILAQIGQADEPHAGSPTGRLSVSVGIAVHTGPLRPPADLVGLADAALYRAKNEGRGCYRMVVASSLLTRAPDDGVGSAA